MEKREQSERVNNKELNLRSKRQQRLTEWLSKWLRLQTKTLLLYISALRLRPVTTKKEFKGKEKTKTCIYNSCSCWVRNIWMKQRKDRERLLEFCSLVSCGEGYLVSQCQTVKVCSYHTLIKLPTIINVQPLLRPLLQPFPKWKFNERRRSQILCSSLFLFLSLFPNWLGLLSVLLFFILFLLLLLLLSTILTYGLLWLFVCSFSVSHITKELLLCGHLESLMWMCAANSFLGSTITLVFHFWMGLNMGMGLQWDQIKTFCFYML